MGVHPAITADQFPKQSPLVGKRAEVVFHFDTSVRLGATILRDDEESPHRMVLQLDDGRVVLSDECQWRPTGAAS